MRWMLIVAGVAAAVALFARSSWSDSASGSGSRASEWPIPVDDGDGDAPQEPGQDLMRYEMPAHRRAYEDLTPAEQESFERAVEHVAERAEAEKILAEAAKERAVIAASEAAQAMIGAEDLGQIGVVP